jgi:16S rRNA (guanine527-N7)-methyltransferase
MDSKRKKMELEEHLGTPITEEQMKLLIAHLEYVVETNKQLNLTSITDLETGFMLHILDSLTALPEINAAPVGELVDIGTGGGFPGIPLAILTGRATTLIEATTKKTLALNRFIEENALEGILRALPRRAEEVALELPNVYSVATARALSSLPSIMELAAPLLKLNGVLVAYKGNLLDEELEKAYLLEKTLGLSVKSLRSLVLPDGETTRTLVALEKFTESKIKLPRRNGQAQRHPLA